jgi:aryl-alcohol dehydrogenase-like predicted oxidoreductase
LGLLVEINILIRRLVKQDFKRREELKVACKVGLDGEDLKPGKIPINPPEAVKKSLSSTFTPKGQLDLQSFRMRSLR